MENDYIDNISKEAIYYKYRNLVFIIVKNLIGYNRYLQKNFQDILQEIWYLIYKNAIYRYDPAKSKFNTYLTQYVHYRYLRIARRYMEIIRYEYQVDNIDGVKYNRHPEKTMLLEHLLNEVLSKNEVVIVSLLAGLRYKPLTLCEIQNECPELFNGTTKYFRDHAMYKIRKKLGNKMISLIKKMNSFYTGNFNSTNIYQFLVKVI